MRATVVCFVVGLVCTGCVPRHARVELPAIRSGDGALPVLTADGRPAQLSDFGSEVTVLAFWQTTCGPCLKELPFIESLYRQYHREPRVAILALNVDDDRAAARKTAGDLGLTLPLLFDHEHAVTRRILGETPLRLPLFVVIDRHFSLYREFGFNAETPREKYLAERTKLIEDARRGQLPAEPTLKSKTLSEAEIQQTLTELRGQLRKENPGASDAEIEEAVRDFETKIRHGKTFETSH